MNQYKKEDGYETFYIFYQIFGILSIIFTIIDILKEIQEVIMFKMKYFYDPYNYPTVIGNIIKLVFLFRDYNFYHYQYSDD